MIKATNISFSYTETPLYERGNFSVGKNMKVGVVGNNGAGKSTLFKLISGEESPDSGKITVEGVVASVPQEVKHDFLLDESLTVQAYIDPTNKKQKYELKKLLAGIGLKLNLQDKPKLFSGGQKTRLAIIRALIQEPDILLLDEPTNFLDTAGKNWIMHLLRNYPHTLLLISHDMELIDNYIQKIIAINSQRREIEEQKGTYSHYLITKKEKDALLKRNILTEQKHIQQLKKGLIKMARNTSKKGVRQRTQLKKRIQRLEIKLPEMPVELRKIRFTFPVPTRIGTLPIVIDHISKSFNGEYVLTNISVSVYRGERLALIGPNGAGKSTLIKILMDILQPDSGKVVRDAQLDVGYYSQEKESFSEEQSVLTMMRKHTRAADNILRPLLAGFLFNGDKINQEIKKLSGGEKTRLAIARLLSKNHNVLILDEPTTYLDVMSQRIILEALKKYTGTLIVVSHTEGFIQELQPNRALLLPENLITSWSDDLLVKVSEI